MTKRDFFSPGWKKGRRRRISTPLEPKVTRRRRRRLQSIEQRKRFFLSSSVEAQWGTELKKERERETCTITMAVGWYFSAKVDPPGISRNGSDGRRRRRLLLPKFQPFLLRCTGALSTPHRSATDLTDNTRERFFSKMKRSSSSSSLQFAKGGGGGVFSRTCLGRKLGDCIVVVAFALAVGKAVNLRRGSNELPPLRFPRDCGERRRRRGRMLWKGGREREGDDKCQNFSVAASSFSAAPDDENLLLAFTTHPVCNSTSSSPDGDGGETPTAPIPAMVIITSYTV